MGHHQSLDYQIVQRFQSILRIGESKHAHKLAGDANKYIFSYSTYHSYCKHAKLFAAWLRKNHKECKKLSQAQRFVNEYLEYRIAQQKSPYTIKLDLSALVKLYGGSTAADYIPTPPRLRKNIKRSRQELPHHKHFSEKRNAMLAATAKATGLRRSELCQLRCGDWELDPGSGPNPEPKYYILVSRGAKGGRPRRAEVLCDDPEAIINFMKAQGGAMDKVFKKPISKAAPIHAWRAEYATAVYLKYARPLDTLPRKEIYYCRKDRKGIKFDKKAMGHASACLGHSFGRYSVVGEHYIRLPQNIS